MAHLLTFQVVKYRVMHLLIAACLAGVLSCSEGKNLLSSGQACFYAADTAWVNKTMESLSKEQKLEQLLMLVVSGFEADSLFDFLNQGQFGGVLLQEDSIHKQVEATELVQSSDVPLLVASTSENGSLSFLQDVPQFPSRLAVQATRDTQLVNQLAGLSGKHARSLGIGALNTPLLREELAISSAALDSMLAHRVLAATRPGGDSLLQTRLDSLTRQGLPIMLMTPTDTLLPKRFDGLRICKLTESEDIKQVVSRSDMLLVPSNMSVDDVKRALSYSLDEGELDQRVRKVLLAKAWCGLQTSANPEPGAVRLTKDPEARLLSRRLFENSATLLKNDKSAVPVRGLKGNRIAVVSVGPPCARFEEQVRYYANASFTRIDTEARDFSVIESVGSASNTMILVVSDSLKADALPPLRHAVAKAASSAKTIIVNMVATPLDSLLQYSSAYVQLYGRSQAEQEIGAQLVFGGIGAQGSLSFAVADLPVGHGLETDPIRASYGIPEQVGIDREQILRIDTIVRQAIAAAATPGCQVFAAIGGNVFINKSYGHHTYSRRRPVVWDDLYDIASVTKVAATTIAAMKMYDQAKLDLDERLGEYFMNTSIDYTRIKADTTVIIDTINVLQVEDVSDQVRGRDTTRINDSLIETRIELVSKVTPRMNIFKKRMRDLLTHRSGIAPSIPIIDFMRYRDSLHGYFNRFYCNESDTDFCIRIAENFYMREDFLDTLWHLTKQMPVYRGEPVYQYTDANMVLAQFVIDSVNGYGLDEYVDKTFYEPLGLRSISYLPLSKFKKHRIVPTEYDRYWRNQTIHGDVHDPTAAILGGVSGNAGLFASAHDVGILFQMLLNGGSYGGARFLSPGIVRLFTSKQQIGHRGLGFDMKTYKSICAASASLSTYGHTGFTGTCVWVDPEIDLVFVFMSNRVHPSAKNWRLNSLKVRNRVHQVIYDALKIGFGQPGAVPEA